MPAARGVFALSAEVPARVAVAVPPAGAVLRALAGTRQSADARRCRPA